ncbi:MAG TPA: molybdenum cofactor guanylyltransferase [Cyclobacteriaceae bacterium]|nr:molybdenum cofactor guanylyltransferase [Cyclobacteriaceae bacterium]
MSKIINGLVLCGGKSSRMGKDKSLINYHGKPQREFLAELLKPFCDQVFVSGPKNSKVSQTNIPDHFDLDSPLNGILSAFHFDPLVNWLTVPVDMPNIDSKAIQYLFKHRDDHKTATCFLNSDGQEPEPLFTIWEAKSKPMLFDFYNSGQVSLKKFLIENDICLVKAPNLSLLTNINTEEELQAYLKQSRKTY